MLVPKLFTTVKEYNKEQFIKDFTAGVIVAIIALPLAIALAIASGVSPEKGLHTAIIGGFLVSFFGGSRVQIGGPTGAFIIIVYGIIQKHGIVGLTIATLIAGLFLIVMGLLRMGSILKFIPNPIITGFTCGIAVTIFSTQIKDFFGLTMNNVPSEFIEKWIAYIESINTINTESLLIGMLSLAIITLWPRLNKKIPGTLLAVVLSTVVAFALKLNVETIGGRFGNLSAAIPQVVIPQINLEIIGDLILPGVTIAVLAAVESLLCAVVADGMIDGRHRSNMELVAQGVANIFSAIFGGIPVTGAIARTAANVKNGGRTPIAGIVHALVLVIIMLLCMPYVKLIPMSSLAAVLIIVSYNMGEWEAFKIVLKAPKSDSFVFIITFVLTIILDLVIAIGVGVVLSSFLFMKRMADVTEVKYVRNNNEDKLVSQLLSEVESPEDVSLYEITGPFFFGAANKFVNVVREMGTPPPVLIIKMSKVPAMDTTGYQGLEMLYEICNKSNTKLIILDAQSQPLQLLKKYGFINAIGEENLCTDIEKTIPRVNRLLTSLENKQPNISA